jgi:hypothetical protein
MELLKIALKVPKTLYYCQIDLSIEMYKTNVFAQQKS